MTYTYCKSIIERGKFDAQDMKDKLDVFLLNNRISQEQYTELVKMVDAKAV